MFLKKSYLRVQCLHEVFIDLTVHVYISVSFKQVRPLLYSGHQFVKDIVKMNKILQNSETCATMQVLCTMHILRPKCFCWWCSNPILGFPDWFWEHDAPGAFVPSIYWFARTGLSSDQVDYLCSGTVLLWPAYAIQQVLKKAGRTSFSALEKHYKTKLVIVTEKLKKHVEEWPTFLSKELKQKLKLIKSKQKKRRKG